MIFTSVQFFVLLAASLSAYFIFKGRKARLTILLAASYVFYFEWSYKYALLLVFSTLLDYSVGYFMGRTTDARWRLVLLMLSITGNLGILCFFKYYNFFVDAFVRFSAVIGLPVSLPVAGVLLPVGISFYTFQTMSYTIDLYRNKIQQSRSLLEFSVFVAFFPQLVAGPIERAANLLPQLSAIGNKAIDFRSFRFAFMRIVWGLFKKLVVANSIALHTDYLFQAYDRLGAMGSVFGALNFGLQIYFDFSAYSDIAIGTAALFGIRIIENFRAPYLSVSPREFWRRWHMSLSTWFRDYLYIPLGGSRVGQCRLYFNLMLVMFIVGLWHGANYNFVAWGVWHGMALILNQMVLRAGIPKVLPSSFLRRAIGWAITMVVVWMGWIFFRAESMGVIRDMMVNLLVFKPGSIPCVFAEQLHKSAQSTGARAFTALNEIRRVSTNFG